MSSSMWNEVAEFMVDVGKIPFPISETLIEFIQTILNEEQAKFILIFKKHSLSLEQIKEGTDLSEDEILNMLEVLMNNGIIVGYNNEGTDDLTYTLMALFPGIIEYAFSKGEVGEKEKKIAGLIEKLISELREVVQENYDIIMPLIQSVPAPERIIHIDKKLDVGHQVVLTTENAFEYIDQMEDIAVVHCYCKQEKDLVNDSCKTTDDREICLVFGDSAQFSIKYNFAKPVSKEEAKDILRKTQDYGLVHKIFESDLDYGRTIDGICSCCKCCCGLFHYYHNGTWPYQTVTSYIYNFDSESCSGCGTCVEKCPMENITLKDDIATFDSKCIGCGICVHFCPEKAIELHRTGPRNVFVLPKRMNPN
ncbi:MAG: 4Fe-4S binding protein [Candidatus Thorarchaeota archaeon]